MKRPDIIARQASFPAGLVGRVVAAVMQRETQALNRHVVAMLDLDQGDRVLDVGAGNGSSLGHIATRTFGGLAVGVDHSPVMCRRAAANNASMIAAKRIHVCCAPSDALPFDTAFFDAVMSVHTLYFWDPVEPHLREIARVLRPGGQFALAFRPAGAPETGDFPAAVYRFRSLPEVSELLAACGFEVSGPLQPHALDDSTVILHATRNHDAL